MLSASSTRRRRRPSPAAAQSRTDPGRRCPSGLRARRARCAGSPRSRSGWAVPAGPVTTARHRAASTAKRPNWKKASRGVAVTKFRLPRPAFRSARRSAAVPARQRDESHPQFERRELLEVGHLGSRRDRGVSVKGGSHSGVDYFPYLDQLNNATQNYAGWNAAGTGESRLWDFAVSARPSRRLVDPFGRGASSGG